jgi:hypothetical protein
VVQKNIISNHQTARHFDHTKWLLTPSLALSQPKDNARTSTTDSRSRSKKESKAKKVRKRRKKAGKEKKNPTTPPQPTFYTPTTTDRTTSTIHPPTLGLGLPPLPPQ